MTRSSPSLLAATVLVAWSSSAQPALDPKADEVIEAAFRQQVSYWLTDDARGAGTVVCLAVEQAGVAHSVAREYLRRFHEPSLRRAAECEGRRRGAVDLRRTRATVCWV